MINYHNGEYHIKNKGSASYVNENNVGVGKCWHCIVVHNVMILLQ